MKTFLIRGVPMAMQQDGWWLNAPPTAPKMGTAKGQQLSDGWRIGLLIGLIALGDILIWDVMPGLSLVVFGAAVVAAALWITGSKVCTHRQMLVVGGTALALLPMVELVQPLSLLIAIIGVSGALAFLAGLNVGELWRGVLRLWPMGVRQTFIDAGGLMKIQGAEDASGRLTRFVMVWFLPVALGLVFVLLFLAANPIAERWVDQLWHADADVPEGARVMFWACLVPLAWTALSLGKIREQLRRTSQSARMGPARQGLINPASVVRALVLFNAVFAVQTLLDVFYLYGGVGLPEGITYAEYAHRGAYPLVVTALLAGGFALLSRRWVQGNILLRVLLMVWVAQNVALVVSSLVRLELYVGVYGLTHLRIAAAIWMGLTAVGLALILWQVWRRRDNQWLMLRGGGLASVVLYACTWVSFDATIAHYNLNHAVPSDYHLLCNLGPASKPVVAAFDAAHNVSLCYPFQYHIAVPNDWRSWGFRNWRALGSLRAIQAGAPV